MAREGKLKNDRQNGTKNPPASYRGIRPIHDKMPNLGVGSVFFIFTTKSLEYSQAKDILNPSQRRRPPKKIPRIARVCRYFHISIFRHRIARRFLPRYCVYGFINEHFFPYEILHLVNFQLISIAPIDLLLSSFILFSVLEVELCMR